MSWSRRRHRLRIGSGGLDDHSDQKPLQDRWRRRTIGARSPHRTQYGCGGDIPGAAKFGDTWTFDVALLDAFVAEKERETWQNGRRPQRAVTGAMARSGAGYKPGVATTDGHFAQTIQKLRASVVKSNVNEYRLASLWRPPQNT